MYGSCFVLFSLLVGKCLLITKSIPDCLFLCAMVLPGRSRAICFLFGPIHQDLNWRVCPESKVIFQLFRLLKRLCSLPLQQNYPLHSASVDDFHIAWIPASECSFFSTMGGFPYLLKPSDTETGSATLRGFDVEDMSKISVYNEYVKSR